jgi:hypothetical protein
MHDVRIRAIVVGPEAIVADEFPVRQPRCAPDVQDVSARTEHLPANKRLELTLLLFLARIHG